MILTIPVKLIDNDEVKVCVYCDMQTTELYCGYCMEYKSLMTIPEWEQYTGEVWEE